MKVIAIARIALDDSGRLRVYPQLTRLHGYEYTWRDASSVRWDGATCSFYVLPVNGFTLADEYRQIVAAVQSEYGEHLAMDAATVMDVPISIFNGLGRE